MTRIRSRDLVRVQGQFRHLADHTGTVWAMKALARNAMAEIVVTVKNNTDLVAEMPLIDLGVPPGFSVISDKLDEAVAKKSIKYTLAA